MRPSDRGYWLSLHALAVFGALFLLLPLGFVVVNSVGPRGIAFFPPESLSLEAYSTIPVRWLRATVSALVLALVAAGLGSVLGTCGALALARGGLRAPGWIDGLLRSPLQVPGLVLGVAFLQLYAWISVSGGPELRNAWLGLGLAHVAVSSPFVMVVVLARLRSLGTELEQAAAGLGASEVQTFFRITLPLLVPAILSGAFFAFLLSIDNVPLSYFLVGTGQALLPVDLFNAIQFDLTRTVYAVSTLVCIGTTVLVAVAFRRLTSVLVVAR